MKLVKCSNGHFYDAEANVTCPYCDDMDKDNKTVQDDSSMIYGERHNAIPGRTGMPQMPKPGQASQMSAMPQPPVMNNVPPVPPNMPQPPVMNSVPPVPPNMPQPPVMNSVPPVPPNMPQPPVMNNVPPVPPNMPHPPVMNNVPPVSPYMTGMTQAAPVTHAQMGNISNMPQTPVMNNISNMPQTPVMNNISNMPQVSVMNNMSNVSQTPVMNNVPNMPQTPVMNNVSNVPQTPVMNNVPNMPQTPMMNNALPAVHQTAEIPGMPVTGWLVCICGEAKGKSYNIVSGLNYVGRRKDMDICIEGDISISRYRHAVVEYSEERKEFLLRLGESKEKIYITRDRQKRILEGTIKLEAYDVITLGRTELMFVPFCGDRFTW